MNTSEYFREILQELQDFGRFSIVQEALPEALLSSDAEVDVDRLIPALRRTIKAGNIKSSNLWLDGTEQPAQVANLLNIIAASRLQELASGTPSPELKESVYLDAFYIFCLAYSAADDEAFKLVIKHKYGESVFLPALAA
jgi:hypothetical protein